MGWLLILGYLAAAVAVLIGAERKQHQVQHGSCVYTFILPEVEHCPSAGNFPVSNSLQRDSPMPLETAHSETSWQDKKLESLKSATENNTQWLQKLENYIQENVRPEIVENQRNVINTQAATILEIGTNLLTQSAENTRKLTDVETQVLNQTSHLWIQLMEFTLSTQRLEKQLLLQTQEVSRLNDKNIYLEQRFAALETRHNHELQMIQQEKQHLQELIDRQNHLVAVLERQLATSTRNSTLLQRQQAALSEQLQQLLARNNHSNDVTCQSKKSMVFRDCAEIYRTGITENGIYNIYIANMTQPFKVFCDMKTKGGGWTVIQRRFNGSEDFHRSWKEYKMGFGDPAGEHWLGNDVIHLLTTSQDYTLQVKLKDIEGNQAYSQYTHFYIDGEEKKYSVHIQGFSGTAGRTSSLTQSGSMFSTKDQDNDCCSCKCAQIASGGWWFEACGPSNLNGIYYAGISNDMHYNGIKWYYWKGPSLVVARTTMMVRPVDF